MQNYEIENKAIIEIVGTQYNNRAINHIGLKVGDKVKILHESDNEHDINAILVLSEDNKQLGYFPKGQAAFYAPAIDSKKYSFTATIIETDNQSSERPILILSVIAEYQKISDKELEKRVSILLKNVLYTYNLQRKKYINCLDDESINEEDVITCWKTVRALKVPFIYADKYLSQKPDVNEEGKICTIDDFNKELDEIELSVNEMLKEYQRMFNESVDIEDEDEYQRVQRLVREKRKSLKEIKDICTSIKQTFEGIEIQFDIKESKESIPENKEAVKTAVEEAVANVDSGENEKPVDDSNVIPAIKDKDAFQHGLDEDSNSDLEQKESVVDLFNPTSYTSKKPTKLNFLGVSNNIDSWIEIYETIIKILYSDRLYKEKLLQYVGKSLVNGRSIDFVDKNNKELLRRTREIAPDFYIEINLSVADILRRIRKILDICGIEYNKAKIYYLNTDFLPVGALDKTEDLETDTNDSYDGIKYNDKTIKEKEFFLEDAIKKLMLSDDDMVNGLRSESGGLSNEALEFLLKEKYGQSISKFQIGLELLKNNNFETNDRIHYYLKLVKHSEKAENADKNIPKLVTNTNVKETAISSSDLQDNYNLSELVIDVLRKNADNIYFQDGMNAYIVSQYLPSELSSKVDIKEIEKVLSDHPNAKEIEDSYYVYTDLNPEKPDVSISDTFEYQSDDEEISDTLGKDVNQGLERDNIEENTGGSVVIEINNRQFNLFDYNDALIQVCEFAIKVKPFAMARINNSNISLNSKPMFYRNSVPIDECKKLSNGLQIKMINQIKEFQVISEFVLDYCGIPKDILKVR